MLSPAPGPRHALQAGRAHEAIRPSGPQSLAYCSPFLLYHNINAGVGCWCLRSELFLGVTHSNRSCCLVFTDTPGHGAGQACGRPLLPGPQRWRLEPRPGARGKVRGRCPDGNGSWKAPSSKQTSTPCARLDLGGNRGTLQHMCVPATRSHMARTSITRCAQHSMSSP